MLSIPCSVTNYGVGTSCIGTDDDELPFCAASSSSLPFFPRRDPTELDAIDDGGVQLISSNLIPLVMSVVSIQEIQTIPR